MSLRRRIMLLTLGVAAMVLLLFAVPLLLVLQQAAREGATERATDVANGVADYVSTSADSKALTAYVARVNGRDDDVRVAVDLPDGTRIGVGDAATPGAGAAGGRPDFDRDHDEGRFARTSSAEVHSVDGGRLVTVAVDDGSGSVVVSAFVSAAGIQHRLQGRLLVAGAAALAALCLAALAAELVTRRLVRGLTDTARTADRLGEGDLSARADEDGPAEVRRVSVALNRLAGRIDELLVAERETVADLSHRLRTPLTVVRLDVEALPDSPQRQELADHLDVLERSLTAVIRAARRPEREGPAPACDPRAVVTDRVAFWAPLMEDQGRTVVVEVSDPLAPVRCAAQDLGAALDALLENVVAHTEDGVRVEVVSRESDGGVEVEVRDQGTGIPRGATDRGRSDRGSSGLGLDIARRCAEASGGGLGIERAGSWTVVRLLLGAAESHSAGGVGIAVRPLREPDEGMGA